MDSPRQLVITLTVTVTLPPDDLDFNSLICAFGHFGDLTVGRLFEVILDALESRIGEDLIASEPRRFVWNGRQGKAPKQWVLPFGQVRHHYRRMLDRQSGSVFCPLREALAIPKYKRLTWPVLAGPLGLVPELSYRRAAAEGRRLQQGAGPGRSST